MGYDVAKIALIAKNLIKYSKTCKITPEESVMIDSLLMNLGISIKEVANVLKDVYDSYVVYRVIKGSILVMVYIDADMNINADVYYPTSERVMKTVRLSLKDYKEEVGALIDSI